MRESLVHHVSIDILYMWYYTCIVLHLHFIYYIHVCISHVFIVHVRVLDRIIAFIVKGSVNYANFSISVDILTALVCHLTWGR